MKIRKHFACDFAPHTYHQTSNISRTLVDNDFGHSDVVGASPVGVAPTSYSFSI